MNVPFLLNKHGDLYFLLNKNIAHIVLFNFLKIEKIIGRKKRYSRKRAQNRYSNMQIMNRKTTTLRTPYVHLVLNGVICPQILYDILLYARHFLLVKFLLKCYFNKVSFELPQNVRWTDKARDKHSYRHKWGKIGPSYLFSENGDLSFLLLFSKQCITLKRCLQG